MLRPRIQPEIEMNRFQSANRDAYSATRLPVEHIVASWRGGPRASSNPWRALTLEWQVSSPPPVFNFDTIPTVVGGPYEYGVPGAVHGIFAPPAEATVPAGVGAGASSGEEGGG